MNAQNRFRAHIRDLVEQYIDEDGDAYPPLLEQLLTTGRHLRSNQDVVGKVQPRSTPPGNLEARELYDRIHGEGNTWAEMLAGHPIRGSEALKMLPVLAARLPSNDQRLHKRPSGLYSTAGRWYVSVRIFLRYEPKPSHYPRATCPHCGFRNSAGGSIYARETLAWCANPGCHDDKGHRQEFSILYLRSLLIDAVPSADDPPDIRR